MTRLAVPAAQSGPCRLRFRLLREVLDFFLEFADATNQIGQLLKRDDLAFGLAIFERRNAKNLHSVFDVGHYPGFGANHDLVADFEMSGNADLSTNGHI